MQKHMVYKNTKIIVEVHWLNTGFLPCAPFLPCARFLPCAEVHSIVERKAGIKKRES